MTGSAIKIFTTEEFTELCRTEGWTDSIEMQMRWWDRGDGTAVYENQDLGHHDLGHKVCMSYGSWAAQLESETPPERLPDGLMPHITGGINWRYQLLGVYSA